MEPRTPQKRTLKAGEVTRPTIAAKAVRNCKMWITRGICLDRSLFGFILRYSKRDQLLIVPLVLGTMVVYYLSLDLPKTIINQAIQGDGFPEPDGQIRWLGFELGRIEYLFALSLV